MADNTITSIKNILAVHTTTSPDTPLVIDSPHSGKLYPEDFNYNCPLKNLRKLEDAYIDDLFSETERQGIPFLCALFARTYIDPNRAIDDIDEHMLDAPWPEEIYGPLAPTIRSEQGHGLVTRCVRANTPIYSRKLNIEEVNHRIQNYYLPYHKTLEKLLNKTYETHGKVWHINMHSMPSALATPKHSVKKRHHGRIRPSDIVLGDLDGQCCEPGFIKFLQNFWEKLNYKVSVNDPFKGAEIIASYGYPQNGRYSLQMEINRSLYMNEVTGNPSIAYHRFKKHCTQMLKSCSQYCKEHLRI